MASSELRSIGQAAAVIVFASVVRAASTGSWRTAEAGSAEASSAAELLEASRAMADTAELRAEPLAPGERIDPNTASAVELDRLPGIGPSLASRIVSTREEGAFRDLADLARVPGIGPKALDRLEDRVRFRSTGPIRGSGTTRAPGSGRWLSARERSLGYERGFRTAFGGSERNESQRVARRGWSRSSARRSDPGVQGQRRADPEPGRSDPGEGHRRCYGGPHSAFAGTSLARAAGPGVSGVAGCSRTGKKVSRPTGGGAPEIPVIQGDSTCRTRATGEVRDPALPRRPLAFFVLILAEPRSTPSPESSTEWRPKLQRTGSAIFS